MTIFASWSQCVVIEWIHEWVHNVSELVNRSVRAWYLVVHQWHERGDDQGEALWPLGVQISWELIAQWLPHACRQHHQGRETCTDTTQHNTTQHNTTQHKRSWWLVLIVIALFFDRAGERARETREKERKREREIERENPRERIAWVLTEHSRPTFSVIDKTEFV